jgi:hypothetical protein
MLHFFEALIQEAAAEPSARIGEESIDGPILRGANQ